MKSSAFQCQDTVNCQTLHHPLYLQCQDAFNKQNDGTVTCWETNLLLHYSSKRWQGRVGRGQKRKSLSFRNHTVKSKILKKNYVFKKGMKTKGKNPRTPWNHTSPCMIPRLESQWFSHFNYPYSTLELFKYLNPLPISKSKLNHYKLTTQ